jgi:hypothetical protein
MISASAYPIMSLSFLELMVICQVHLIAGFGLPVHKAHRFCVHYNRYRYHKNPIIKKNISPREGTFLYSLSMPILPAIVQRK